jgi:hypothetical protein
MAERPGGKSSCGAIVTEVLVASHQSVALITTFNNTLETRGTFKHQMVITSLLYISYFNRSQQ